MRCNNCGAEVKPGAVFCENCGANVQAQAQPQNINPNPAFNPNPGYIPNPGYGYGARPVVPGKGFGIASMVLGIVALVFFCLWYIAIPCAIVGAALGANAYNKAKAVNMKSGMATAGIVCSVIALGIAVLFILLVFLGVASVGLSL